MKSRLGILSALIFSLAVAGSALAGTTSPKAGKAIRPVSAEMKTKTKNARPKKHHKTKKAKQAMKRSSKKAASPAK